MRQNILFIITKGVNFVITNNMILIDLYDSVINIDLDE